MTSLTKEKIGRILTRRVFIIDVIHRKVGEGEFSSLLQFSALLFVSLISNTKEANSAMKIAFVLDNSIFYTKPKPLSELSIHSNLCSDKLHN